MFRWTYFQINDIVGLMQRIILENTAKNIVLALILIFSYFEIEKFFQELPVTDNSVLGSVLVAVSILAVTACFGNFAFTYEKIDHRSLDLRILAHFTTGFLMLLIGLSLEMTSVIAKLLIGDFLIFDLSLVLLYLSSILYDFWDLRRVKVES